MTLAAAGWTLHSVYAVLAVVAGLALGALTACYLPRS